MAFTLTKLKPLQAYSVDGGFDVPLYPYTDADSATYLQGTPLIFGSGGNLVAASTGPTTGIVGLSAQPGSNIASGAPLYNSVGNAGVQTPLLVVPALPNIIFEGNIGNGDADYAASQANVWVAYGLSKDTTTGLWYVDVSLTTTASAVVIVGIKNAQQGSNSDITLGTTVGLRVLFKFLYGATFLGLGITV